MSLGDTMYYFLYSNPLSAAAVAGATKTAEVLSKSLSSIFMKETPHPMVVHVAPDPLWKIAGFNRVYMKLAGVSGALAVCLTAYVAHSNHLDEEKECKKLYKVATKYHLIHSLALLPVPLARFPSLTGTLFSLGILLFCGSCYYKARTKNSRFSRVTPIGGCCFILGWLSFAL
ncbi:transmembrane protein 256 homolog [Cimex lectularius]|uniref:Transmembrane protein 256 homolog n=1 Tax=Cimex lectularius TaxID=79782 RepID=A0A8I6TLI3_CIMLE|nr:transmembrane protein 256 homolog [Cimex lectularius]